MLKIGEFSILSKTTIKTLRYYEKEGLLLPSYVDEDTNYRYYEYTKLEELTNIISLRELGLSIKDIKAVLNGGKLNDYLNKRKIELIQTISQSENQLQKIISLLEERKMNNEITIKMTPACVVYYEEGTVKDYSQINEFVMQAAEDCLGINPNIKCIPEDYCFITYLDGKPTDENIRIRYSEAVVKKGKENEKIKFMDLPSIKVVSIYHHGAYRNLANTYTQVMKYLQANNLEMIELPRERYIDGCWNKDKEEDYLTEIQVPIK